MKVFWKKIKNLIFISLTVLLLTSCDKYDLGIPNEIYNQNDLTLQIDSTYIKKLDNLLKSELDSLDKKEIQKIYADYIAFYKKQNRKR